MSNSQLKTLVKKHFPAVFEYINEIGYVSALITIGVLLGTLQDWVYGPTTTTAYGSVGILLARANPWAAHTTIFLIEIAFATYIGRRWNFFFAGFFLYFLTAIGEGIWNVAFVFSGQMVNASQQSILFTSLFSVECFVSIATLAVFAFAFQPKPRKHSFQRELAYALLAAAPSAIYVLTWLLFWNFQLTVNYTLCTAPCTGKQLSELTSLWHNPITNLIEIGQYIVTGSGLLAYFRYWCSSISKTPR